MADLMGEVIGTAILLLLGCGVVANVVLSGTKGQGGGWIVIAWGYAWIPVAWPLAGAAAATLAYGALGTMPGFVA